MKEGVERGRGAYAPITRVVACRALRLARACSRAASIAPCHTHQPTRQWSHACRGGGERRGPAHAGRGEAGETHSSDSQRHDFCALCAPIWFVPPFPFPPSPLLLPSFSSISLPVSVRGCVHSDYASGSIDGPRAPRRCFVHVPLLLFLFFYPRLRCCLCHRHLLLNAHRFIHLLRAR